MRHRFLIPLVFLALCGVGCAGQEDVSALIRELKEQDRQVRKRAAYALGQIGPAAKEAVPALIAALKDKDGSVRRNAASALGKIGPAAKEAVPALEAAARDGVDGAESALKEIRGKQ